MNSKIGWPLALLGAGAGAAVLRARRVFDTRLDALDRALAEGQRSAAPRADLPPEVRALAERLGADPQRPAMFVDLAQSGAMWFQPGGRAWRFTARQRIGTSRAGFVWRAGIGPFGLMAVVDSFVDGAGLCEVRVGGAIRAARVAGTAAIDQGEALRHLAELPWNPDAMLFDHGLRWTVDGSRAIRVSMGEGPACAEILLGLDADGVVETAFATARQYADGSLRPWSGRFGRYRTVDGRRIPTRGQVAWVLDGVEFVYWRGSVTA